MFLGVSNHAHENESYYDKSGYEVLHSPILATAEMASAVITSDRPTGWT